MEKTNTENVNDDKDKDEIKSEKMEVDDEAPHSHTEPTVNLQSPSNQSVLPGEPCTICQSEPSLDQCTHTDSEHKDHSATSQTEPKEDPCTNIKSDQTSDQSSGQTEVQHISMQPEETGDCTEGHSGPTEGHSGPTEGHSGPTEGHSGPTEGHSGPTEGHSGPTGGHSGPTGGHSGPTEGHSGPTGGQHTCNSPGHADVKCETVVSPQTSTGSLAMLSMQYRGNSSDDECSDSDSDSSSSTSSSSSSSSSSEPLMINRGVDDDDGVAMGSEKKLVPVKTQGELLLENLPEVENLTISLPDDTAMEPIGTIASIVEKLVIVESYKNTAPLNEESVLFSQKRNSIGKVFEVFGPICQPYYVLLFNSNEEISKKELKVRDPVYFAPKIKDFTGYIFTEQLKEIRGSDASWKNDQEPPPELLDYSDDEQEKLAKQKLKEQKRRQNDSDTDDESEGQKATPAQKPTRRKPRQNRNAPRGQHHNRGGGFHSNYHAHPHFPPPDYMFPHSEPSMFPFQGPMYPPFPRPPPFHMGMPPWPPGANQGFMFHPPPPPPPPPSNQ